MVRFAATTMRPVDVDLELLTRRVTELTRERDEANVALTAERERNLALLRQCDELAGEILALRRGMAAPSRPALMTEQARRLEEALATIRNMERSWFWRMRLLSVRIRSWFRRSAP